MDEQIKKIVDVLNQIPKTNLNYAIEIYNRYSDKFSDGIFEVNDKQEKVFILPYLIKVGLGKLGEEINNEYFTKLEEFFRKNYKNDFLLKIGLFLQVMSEKTKNYFSVNNGNEIIKAGKYFNLMGLEGEFELTKDKTKNEVCFDIVNLFLSKYLKQVIFIRMYIIYTIITILEEKNYSSDLTDDEIFEAINLDLEKSFIENN